METILDYLKRRLKEIGPSHWEDLATAAKVAPSLPRKIAYGDRENPGVVTVQPLLDYLEAEERGEKVFPWNRRKARA